MINNNNNNWDFLIILCSFKRKVHLDLFKYWNGVFVFILWDWMQNFSYTKCWLDFSISMEFCGSFKHTKWQKINKWKIGIHDYSSYTLLFKTLLNRILCTSGQQVFGTIPYFSTMLINISHCPPSSAGLYRRWWTNLPSAVSSLRAHSI
jgi:hypothetical protein